jgi:hypothetical protein
MAEWLKSNLILQDLKTYPGPIVKRCSFPANIATLHANRQYHTAAASHLKLSLRKTACANNKSVFFARLTESLSQLTINVQRLLPSKYSSNYNISSIGIIHITKEMLD